MRLTKILRLATRDYGHEWQMSGCFVLALAAVLGPMLVLFGLKFGIVGGMLDQLVENPENREVRPVSSGRFTLDWFGNMARRSDVAFVVPRTRSIAATIDLSSDKASRILPAEMIPSGRGDPLLPADGPVADGMNDVILSQAAAEHLQVQAGDRIDGSIVRHYRGRKERVHLDLSVAAVAPVAAFARDGVFADARLVEALEEYRDGRAVPELGWQGDPPAEQRSYPGFRLYAKSIYDVNNLKDDLTGQGIEVRTKAADIDLVMRMDRNLSAIYWAIAVIGLFGFSLSLGASLWANVDRKRKELSVLRLVGFRTGDIVWFPVTQALYTGVLGWLLAVAIYFGAAYTINGMLVDQLASGQQVCVLLPQHYLMAFAVTVGAAVLAAALAGWRSARIEPSEGLREI
ncbi:MAG: FtsX-like permease family protein [Gammaproteobacteria bacterium]|nr:FtsX-like permease family protein [Gammaproteobacteria bacterium]